MDILGGIVDFERAALQVGKNSVKTRDYSFRVLRRQDSGFAQHIGVGNAAGYVLHRHSAVKAY